MAPRSNSLRHFQTSAAQIWLESFLLRFRVRFCRTFLVAISHLFLKLSTRHHQGNEEGDQGVGFAFGTVHPSQDKLLKTITLCVSDCWVSLNACPFLSAVLMPMTPP